uniref:Ig-like domain-containing protein n=1 Tax=Romanomermis culicivorax TaxID=13658 RepID=A0A915J1M4_ROMCU
MSTFRSRNGQQQDDDPKWKDFFIVGPSDQPYYVRDDDQSLRLPCAISPQYANDPLFIKEWFFVGGSGPQIITTNNENRRPDLYDIETQRSGCNGCYNLKIKRIKYDSNNGKFYCQLSKIDLLIRAPVANVVVLVKPGHPSISTHKLSLNEGTLGRMVCETAGGNPAPEIRWFFSNGTETTNFALQTNATDLTNPTISILQWPVSANDHQREISCLVRNEAMQPTDQPLMARSGALNVFYSPIVKTEPNSPYNVISGHSAKLKCEADANPPVTKYSWHFNNRDLSYAGSTINIEVNRSSAGNYTCFAENIDGKKAHELLFVNVLYAPEISVPSEIRAAVGRKVSLSCSSESNPAPTSISWSFPDGRSVEGRSLTIESVALRDAGNYTCTVKNHLTPTNEAAIEGSSSKSTTLLVDHPPGKASIFLTGAAPT